MANTMKCPHCGKTIKATATACPFCYRDLTEPAAIPEPPTPADDRAWLAGQLKSINKSLRDIFNYLGVILLLILITNLAGCVASLLKK